MKDERPYSNMVWIYRISRDECEKEIKQKSNEKFWNVESCNDSQRSNLRFFAQLNSFHDLNLESAAIGV